MTSRPDFATLLQLPILQAPTGSIAGPELAAAVSAAGGIGALALTWTSPDVAVAHIESIRSKTDRPFLVNFALAFPPRSLEAALSARVPVVTFSWGDPSQYLEQVHAAGALCGVQVTSALGAERYADLGFDFLICQGSEAGGHVQANRSLWDLLPEVVGAAAGCPVVAAGGIGNGYDIARALSSSMGAVGAMLGTRFVATVESRAHTEYRELIRSARARDTALTVCFEGGWPYAAQRVLRNSTLNIWEAAGSPSIGQRPGEDDTVGYDGAGDPILRYADTAPRHGFSGEIEAMCCYAGTSVEVIDDIPHAAALMARLMAEYQSVIIAERSAPLPASE